MERILEIKNLEVSFNTYAGEVKAVRNINFHLNKGETLAIVGESGSGKTVTSKSIMRILPTPPSIIKENSQVLFEGKDITELSDEEMRNMRGNNISMIFQDPMTSLNPTMKVGEQIAESMIIHEGKSKQKALIEAIDLLRMVGIPNAEDRANQYPHEYSGGMRQRAMIAIALACNPKVLIADEPTTALDVTIQAQIMDLIGDLQKKNDTAVILVTHDLGVVAEVADRIQVMYGGKIVESGTVEEIFNQTRHPYTYALLKSIPRIETESKSALYSLDGSPPDLISPPKGCPFAPRCAYCMSICRLKMPEAYKKTDTHIVSCWLNHNHAPFVEFGQEDH